MGFTHAGIGTLLLKSGADDWAPDRWDNKEHRIQLVFKNLRAAEDPDAAVAALELARMTLEADSPSSAPRGRVLALCGGSRSGMP